MTIPQFENYHIKRQLGTNTRTLVYEAVHKILKRRVAIKILPFQTIQASAQFMKEAEIVSSLRHPAIVNVFEFGRMSDGRNYYIMDYLEGELLSERIHNHAAGLSVADAVRLSLQIAEGISVIHNAKIIHRDIKPSNIIITNESVVPNREQIKIIDFCIAMQGNSRQQRKASQHQALGTPAYMAPEQWKAAHEVDERADIYSLGVTLYHIFTGQPPFVANSSIECMALHILATAESIKKVNQDVPEEISNLIDKMLSKLPFERPQLAEIISVLHEHDATIEISEADIEKIIDIGEMINDDNVLGKESNRSVLRKWLTTKIRTDSDFNGFCMDYLQNVYAQFSDGMNRTQKINLIFDHSEDDAIRQAIEKFTIELNQVKEKIIESRVPGPGSDLRIEQKLKQLLREREELVIEDKSFGHIDQQILDVRRKYRLAPFLEEGMILGNRYRLMKLLGKGGFAAVWKAYDRESGSVVAIKILHDDLSQDQWNVLRFKRGARVPPRIFHLNIVHILSEPQYENGVHYFAMEYCSKGNLEQLVLGGTETLQELLRIFFQAGGALHAAHDAGFVHRDVKPANILINSKGDACLADFDLVFYRETTGATRGGIGTYIYAAPEVIGGTDLPDRRADVFSFGMMALFILYGKILPPSAYRSFQKFIKDINIPDAIQEVLCHALSDSPADRPDTIEKFCEHLRMGLKISGYVTSE